MVVVLSMSVSKKKNNAAKQEIVLFQFVGQALVRSDSY